MQCAIVDSSGAVLLTNEQPPDCSEVLLLSKIDYDNLRDPFNSDPDFSDVYWAFGACILLWAVGVGVGLVVNVVKRVR